MGLRLGDISDFDGLLAYLRDELDWPVHELAVEELTFDYDPCRDLGLPPEAAAEIVTLQQLRPLQNKQDWAVFHITFGQRYLPLRLVQRVLTALVTRGDAADDPASRRLWQPADLLLIAASGTARERRIDFAQCVRYRGTQKRDVRLLGWHPDEPDGRLEWIEAQVRAGLRWPDPSEAACWPARWHETFLARPARPRPSWSELTEAQRRTLVKLYTASTHSVDVLPYTLDFVWLLDAFNRATGLSLTHHEFWRALSSARKGGHLPKKQRGR